MATSTSTGTTTATAMTTTTPTGPDPAVLQAIERGNVVVFLDVAMGQDEAALVDLGRIKLELFVKDVRKNDTLK